MGSSKHPVLIQTFHEWQMTVHWLRWLSLCISVLTFNIKKESLHRPISSCLSATLQALHPTSACAYHILSIQIPTLSSKDIGHNEMPDPTLLSKQRYILLYSSMSPVIYSLSIRKRDGVVVLMSDLYTLKSQSLAYLILLLKGLSKLRLSNTEVESSFSRSTFIDMTHRISCLISLS